MGIREISSMIQCHQKCILVHRIICIRVEHASIRLSEMAWGQTVRLVNSAATPSLTVTGHTISLSREKMFAIPFCLNHNSPYPAKTPTNLVLVTPVLQCISTNMFVDWMFWRSNAFSNTCQLVIQNNLAEGNPNIGPLKGNLWILLHKLYVLTASKSPRRIDADCQSLVDEHGPCVPCAPGDGCTSSGQSDESVPSYHNVVLWGLTRGVIRQNILLGSWSHCAWF